MANNPFESQPDVDNFPPFASLFESSPSIDTIARTKPVEFSLGERSRGTGAQQSPLSSAARSVHSVTSRSPRQPNPRVAKQLNFSLPDGGSGVRRVEGGVSRKMAEAAGWPTPQRRAAAAAQQASVAPADDAAAILLTDDASVSSAVPPDDPAHNTGGPATKDLSAKSGATQPRRTLEPAESQPRLPTVTPGRAAAMLLPSPARMAAAMPRSPSAPIFRTASKATSGGGGVKAADEPATTQSKANTTQVGQETLDEVRKALLQPPSFAFTQYLRGLRSRWTQRPLVRSALSELGLSPSRHHSLHHHPLASEPWAAPPVMPPVNPMRHSWPPPTPAAMPMSAAAYGPPMMMYYHPAAAAYPPPPPPGVSYPTQYYYYPPPQMQMAAPPPPPYWGASMPAMWPPPPFAAAPPPAAWAASPAPMHAPMWPPSWSTAALPASREMFKYVL